MFLHDRASAGKLKNLIIDIFSGKSDYPSNERGLNLHDQLETEICNQSALYRDWETDRKSTRLNSSHSAKSRMPSSA